MAVGLRGAAGVRARRGRAVASTLTCRNTIARADAVRARPASLFPVRAARPGSTPRSLTPGRSTRRCCRSTRCRPTGRYDLRDRLVCGQGLDNGFGGWGGEARMSDPDWPYRAAPVVARRALLPALFAARRRDFRRRAGDPRQCRAQCARGANGRSSACACSSRARR